MKDSQEKVYSIPAQYRRTENLHILFWLVKDAFWALNIPLGGMVMIIPTLSVAVWIAWRTRNIAAEFFHNLAIISWIVANCTWMTGDFFGWDEGTYGLRRLALIPFAIGLLILAVYYLVIAPREKNKTVSRGTLEQAPVKEQ